MLHAPSAIFAAFAGAVFLVFLLAAALVSLSRFFMDVSGIDLLAAIGNSSNIGANKLQLLCILMACCLVVTGGAFAVLFRRPGLAMRLCVLALLAPAYLATYAFLYYPVHHASLLEQIEITTAPPMKDPAFFSKSHLNTERISDDGELYRDCRLRFNEVRDDLKKQWGIEDNRKLESLFLMNTVSAFWGFGNSIHPDREGCVTINETTGFRLRVPDGIGDYLQSEIGCCSDSAHVLKLLLDRAGIPNRRVTIAHGHVMNEVLLPGGWMTLDASTNMAFAGHWTSIQKRHGHGRNSVRVLIFPHSNHVAGVNPLYRPEIGHLRLTLLLDALNRSAPPVAFPDGIDVISSAKQARQAMTGNSKKLLPNI
ncbi:MAG: transglutaminase-like domain-containing protein [Syntrophales bacterium]